MNILKILLVSLAAVFAENLVFVNYLGIEPFIGGTNDWKETHATGVAILILTAVCCFATSLFDKLLLIPLSIEYMRTVVFVLVIAVIWKLLSSFRLHIALSEKYVFSSTAVLATALMVSSGGFGPLGALIYGALAGAGFLFSSFLFVGIKKQLEYAEVPEFLKGLPILLITAGLIALVFTGFQGMKFI